MPRSDVGSKGVYGTSAARGRSKEGGGGLSSAASPSPLVGSLNPREARSSRRDAGSWFWPRVNSAWARGEEGEARAGEEANRARASSCEGAYGDKERTLAVLKSRR